MTRSAVLTNKKPGDSLNALVYYESDHSWGWWCPACTPPDSEPFGRENYGNRENARRAAVDHEKASHNDG